MQITRKSMLSGTTRTLDIAVTEDQLAAWRDGATIQSAAPHLSADEREFMITGITKEEWDEAFADAPDEEEEDGE